MTARLRRAEESDLEAVIAIERATFESDAWSEATMLAELRSEHTHYLVAYDEERAEVIGYAGLLVPGGGEADVQTIAVAAGFRGRGLGRTLLEALLAEAERRHVEQIFLEVRADNPVAQELYRSVGFEAIGVRPRYYQPDGVDAVVMRRVRPAEDTASEARA